MRKPLIVVAALLLSCSTIAFSAGAAEPQAGMWWSPVESGRGYSLDPQGDLMVVTSFAYDNSGRMQWYYSPGQLSQGGSHWSGPLLMFDFGQPLSGVYVFPASMGNDGTISLDFSSRVTGIMTLPSGRRIPIERQNFGVGMPPQALLGEWLFAYTIGNSTFADRYRFTTISNSTSTGNGVVVDLAKIAGFEYQVSGTFAGQVLGFQFSSTGVVQNQYLWQLQMEEGRGNWVAPTTFNQYGMNAYKTATPSGLSKSEIATAAASVDLLAKGPFGIAHGISIEDLAAQDSERGEIARSIWVVLQSQ
jgi:hypothetical protein